jgi:hypothetical protein
MGCSDLNGLDTCGAGKFNYKWFSSSWWPLLMSNCCLSNPPCLGNLAGSCLLGGPVEQGRPWGVVTQGWCDTPSSHGGYSRTGQPLTLRPSWQNKHKECNCWSYRKCTFNSVRSGLSSCIPISVCVTPVRPLALLQLALWCLGMQWSHGSISFHSYLPDDPEVACPFVHLSALPSPSLFQVVRVLPVVWRKCAHVAFMLRTLSCPWTALVMSFNGKF